MIYLDIIMTDTPDANTITPKVDHRAFLLKDVLKKPKLSFWDLYKLKHHLETGYEKLSEKTNEEECDTKSIAEPAIVEEPAIEIQDNPDNIRERMDSGSGDDTGSIE